MGYTAGGQHALRNKFCPEARTVHQDVIGGSTHPVVPEVEQPAVYRSGVGMQVVQGVDRGHPRPAQRVHEQGVPQVGPGDVNQVGLQAQGWFE